MEYIIIIIICISIIIAVRMVLDGNAKKLKEIAQDEQLNEITNKMPENIDVCKEILKKLGNEKVKIEETKDTETSLYIAITDKISIGNIKKSFTRIQTIAHECIHSVQRRKILLFNFVFSNIYLLYYAIIIILTLCNVIKDPMLQIVILLLLTLTFYFVRSLLEIDAMTKAKYLAKEYMQENKLCTNEELNKIVNGFEEVNKIGIPLANFVLYTEGIIKIMIYCIIALLKT